MIYMTWGYGVFVTIAALLWLGTEERETWYKTPFFSFGKAFLFATVLAPFFIVFVIAVNLAKVLGLTKLESALFRLK